MSNKKFSGVWNDIARAVKCLGKLGINFNQILKKEIGSNSWKCDLAPDRIYSVSLLRCKLDNMHSMLHTGSNIVWSRVVPIKVTCFIWRAVMDGLPTLEALSHRGINIPSMMCSVCNLEVETRDHVLVGCCRMAKKVWDLVLNWCELNWTGISKVDDLLNWAVAWGRCPKKTSISQLYIVWFALVYLECP